MSLFGGIVDGTCIAEDPGWFGVSDGCLSLTLRDGELFETFLPCGEQELRFDDVGDGCGAFLTDREEEDPLGLAEGDGEGVLLRERNGKGKSCVSSSSSIGEERSRV